METIFQYCLFFGLFLLHVKADPEFCSRGFTMASRFYKCWEQATFSNKYPPLHEPHQYLDSKFVESYAKHMCSVVKPEALKCLESSIKECSNINKLMDMADQSGGACLGNRLNPYFKSHVIDRLVSIKGDSACFELADNTYECYQAAGQKVMQMGGQSDNIVTFHRVADKFFDAYWGCMVQIYKSNEKLCPNWQIPMLLTLQKTAMPSLFGLRLRPEQIERLELDLDEDMDKKSKVSNPGPSSVYLLIQLHKTRPDVSRHEDSVVLELTDLNEDKPHLALEQGGGLSKEVVNVLTLKEIKKLLRETRRRNKELKDFINQAQSGMAYKKSKKSKKAKVDNVKNNRDTDKRLHLDSMIA